MLIGNGQEFDLYRSEPYGECAGIVFDEDAQEAFDTAEAGAVYHDRAMLLAVFADISHIEAFRHEHIELDCTALPGTADGILDVEIELRTVEGAVAFVNLIRNISIFQYLAQGARR